MSKTTKELELESELTTVKELISDRINQANELKLPGKINKVAEIYGVYNYNESYCFSKKGLIITIKSIAIKSPHIEVMFGEKKDIVFNANLHQNDVGQIHLYIPGAWEQRIEELYNGIPELLRKRNVYSLQNQINQLKSKWHIKEPIKCPFWQYCKSYRKISDVCTEDQSSCMSFKEFKAGERLLEVINIEEKSI